LSVGTGAPAGACGDPGAGTPIFAAAADGFVGAVDVDWLAVAVASGGFATGWEAGRTGGSDGTSVPGTRDGFTAEKKGGGTGLRAIPTGGRSVRSITCGGPFGGPESAKIIAAPTKRCRRSDALAPLQAALPVQPRGAGTLSGCLITQPSCAGS